MKTVESLSLATCGEVSRFGDTDSLLVATDGEASNLQGLLRHYPALLNLGGYTSTFQNIGNGYE